MTRVVLAALLGHWRRNPLQLITLLAGLALGTALWSGVQAINAEARASYDAAEATLGRGLFAQITAADGGAIPQQTYIALRRAGWAVSPVVEGALGRVRVVGIDPLTAPIGVGPGGAADLGAFITAPGQVFGTVQTLANLGLPIAMDNLRGKGGNEIATQLHFLGLPSAAAQQFDAQLTTANLVPVLSPRDGVVTTRDVVAGEGVDTTKTLFTIVDNRRMWLMLNVALEDAQYVSVGQQVVFQPDGGSHEHAGQITWISSRVDSDTRTVKVRAELPNDDGDLRDESFGAGQIVLRDEVEAIVAPNDAIHWDGCCYVAFVRDRNFLAKDSYKVFHTRMIRPGVTNGDYTEVIAGLLPDEVVVTKGSGVLRAELLKGNLGAG